MPKVLQADGSSGDAYASATLTPPSPPVYYQFDVLVPAGTTSAIIGASRNYTADLFEIDGGHDGIYYGWNGSNWFIGTDWHGDTTTSITPNAWHTFIAYYDGSTISWSVDGTSFLSYAQSLSITNINSAGHFVNNLAGEVYYNDNVRVGTTSGGTDVFADDFESGGLTAWTSTTGSVSVVSDPGTGILVLKADCSSGDAWVAQIGLDALPTPWWATYEVGMPSGTATVLNTANKNRSAQFHYLNDAPNFNVDTLGAVPEVNGTGPWDLWGYLGGAFFVGSFSLDEWRTVQIHWDGTTLTVRDVDNSVDLNSYTFGSTPYELDIGGNNSWGLSDEIYYFRSVVIGSTAGGSDLFTDGFSDGDFSHWSSTHGTVSLVPEPSFSGGGGGGDGSGDGLHVWMIV